MRYFAKSLNRNMECAMTVMSTMPDFDVADFRRTLGCFPTGVTIVTALTSTGAPVGVTISSFNSVSMEPPLVLWSLSRSAASLPVFHASDGFAINVLSATQADLPKVFSSPVAERFDAVDWSTGSCGYPVLTEATAVIECRTYARYDGGDHEIFLGQVLSHHSTDRTPLVFGKGKLGAFAVGG